MSKKKIVAIVLFLFISMYVTTFAGSGDGLINTNNANNQLDGDQGDNSTGTGGTAGTTGGDTGSTGGNTGSTGGNTSSTGGDLTPESDTVVLGDLELTTSVEAGILNNLGWTNKDYSFNVDLNELSTNTITSISYCLTDLAECTPNTSTLNQNFDIPLNTDGSYKVCVVVNYANGTTSELICSSSYNLDKTAPEAGNVLVTGVLGNNGWFISNVDLEAANGSDSLSGHATTTIDFDSITESTTGTTVTVTTTDNAGNVSTREIEIKVDQLKPELSFNDEIITTVGVNQDIDLTLGAIYSDLHSGIDTDKGLVIDSSKLDLTTPGVYEVTYTVYDNAGHVTTIKRNVTVVGLPVIEFTNLSADKVNANGWMNKNFAYDITATDGLGNEITNILFCKSNGSDCTPDNIFATDVNIKTNSADNRICAIAYDMYGNSTTSCERDIKLDKNKPIIEGHTSHDGMVFEVGTDLEVVKEALLNGVTTEENYNKADAANVSGLNGEGINLVTRNLDLTTPGTYAVKYKSTDNAGNTKTVTINVVVAYAPDFELTTNIIRNPEGWVKYDFTFQVEGMNDTDTAKYCLTSEESCEPTTEVNGQKFKMTLESASSKACVTVTNEYGLSTTKCSEVYKIDKQEPTLTGTETHDGDVFLVGLSSNELLNSLLENVIATENTDAGIDEVSGLDSKGIKIKFYDKDDNEVSALVVASTTGTYTAKYIVNDNAGHYVYSDLITINVTSMPEFEITDNANTNDAGWARKDFDIIITGANSTDVIKYCMTTEETCVPSVETTGTFEFTKNTATTKVCVSVTNKFGYATTKCSSNYKLDKDGVVFSGASAHDGSKFEIGTTLEEITAALLKNVSVRDNDKNASGIDISGVTSDGITFNTSKLDLTTPGTYEIMYVARDNAGNKDDVTISIEIVAPKPEITLTTDASSNAAGWVNENINVTINGLESTDTVKTCLTDGLACTPTTDEGRVISNESSSSKMCVVVTNEYGVDSDVVCTDPYKLDTTAPTAGEIVLTGDRLSETITTKACPDGYESYNSWGSLADDCRKQTGTSWGFPKYDYKDYVTTTETLNSDWFKGDITISHDNSSDNLSGVVSFNTNFDANVISVDGDNITVELTVTDAAGNVSAPITVTTKKDAVNPVIDLDVIAREGVEGWFSYLDGNEPTCIDIPFVGTQCTSSFAVNAKNTEDALSGLKSITINGTNIDLTNPQNINITTTSITTEYDVEVVAVDNAGNTITETVTIKFDSSKPEINFEGLFDTEKWYNTDFTLSGVDTTPYLGQIFDPQSGILSYTTNPTVITAEGIHTVEVVATNKAGLTATSTMTVRIDKTAPTISGIEDVEILVGETFDINAGVLFEDNLSGKGPLTNVSGILSSFGVDIPGLDGVLGEVGNIPGLGDLVTPENGYITIIPSLNGDELGILDSIDTSKPGIYTVYYIAADKAGNYVVDSRQVTVKADAPTIELGFNLKDPSKPLGLDNFELDLNFADSTDGKIENFTFCMPGQEKCELNIELDSNLINSLITDYIPEDFVGLAPSIDSIYAVAEATNEDICITVHTGLFSFAITECVGYNPVADGYNDVVTALEELEAKIQAKIEEEIQKITDARDAAFEAIEAEVDKLEAELLELRNSLVVATEEAKAAIEAEIALIEAEIARIQTAIETATINTLTQIQTEIDAVKAEIEEVRTDVKTVIDSITNVIDEAQNKISETKENVKNTVEDIKNLFN